MAADNRPNLNSRGAGSTSRSLLAELQHDDAAAWVRLVHLYSPLVAAWCRRMGVAQQDVADIEQDVFGAVAANLARFRKERPQDTFRGWLSVITRNKVHDYYRRRADEPAAAGGTEASRRLAQVPDLAGGDEGIGTGDRGINAGDRGTRVREEGIGTGCDGARLNDDAMESAAFGEVLRRALASIRNEFHEQTWRAFWIVVVEGRSTADVAAELSMQPGAIRVCKSRVLSRLRRELGDAEG